MQGKFEVRNAEVEESLKTIGETLRDSMPKGYGFVLLIASSGPGGSMFYASNFDRQGVCNMMREFIAMAEPN